MNTQHEFCIQSKCPVDGKDDHYFILVETSRLISIEIILDTAKLVSSNTIYQEELTEQLARALSARVTTIGYHSGVKTTCTAGLL